MTIKKDVFISYSSLEYDEAVIVRGVLEKNGISCWMAPESIPIGSDYTKEIPAAISGCRIFLLILSDNSQRSKWVPLELDRAYNEGKIILPFVIKNCPLSDDFNFLLARTQRINAYFKKSEALELLVNEIRRILTGAPVEPVSVPQIKKKRPSGVVIGIYAFVAAILGLLAILWATGALSSGKSTDTEPTSVETTPYETTPDTQAPTEAVIGTISDYVGVSRETTFYSSSLSANITHRIPKILIDSDDADDVNKEIDDIFGASFDQLEQGGYPRFNYLDYDVYLNGDVLSIVIAAEIGAGNDWDYTVYNFDVTIGKHLTNRTLCKKIGSDWDTVKKSFGLSLRNYFIKTYPDFENKESMYMTLSEDNLNASQLFIGSRRKIYAACTIYIPAGSGSIQTTLETSLVYNF